MRFFSTLIASVLGTFIALGFILLFGVLFIIALASAGDQTPSVRPGSVLIADLGGAYPESAVRDPFAEAFLDAPSLDLHDLTAAFQKAAEDDRIEGVWLRMGMVQGSWASLQAMRRAILTFRASGKPVFASSGLHAMSEAEYYLASAADSVFMGPEALFELNGFSMDVMFYAGLLDKLGIEAQTVRAGRFKGAVEPYLRDDLSVENKAQLQAIVDAMETEFLTVVGESRTLGIDTLRELADRGSVITAREARVAGLLDALAYDAQVESRLKSRLEIEPEDDLRTIRISHYARTIRPASRTEGTIAVVYADGTIVPGRTDASPIPGMGSAMVGSETFVRAMDRAGEDESVQAIVLRINSPGGFAPAADEMLESIRRAASQKPLYVSMGGYAASGGYWIAAEADTIVAEPLTLTGSIGVFGLFFDISGLYEDHLGITFDGVKTSPSADMLSGLRSMSSDERRHLAAMTDRTYDEFLQIVADGRGMTVEDVDAIAQGRVWTGRAALDVGLVDVLGGLDATLDIAAKAIGLERDQVRIRELPRPASFMERLNESMVARLQARFTPEPAARAIQIREEAERFVNSPGPYALLPYHLVWR